MKKITILIALISFVQLTNAQSKAELRQAEKRKAKIEEVTANMIANDTDSNFNIMTAPAKYLKESSVILNKRTNFVFGNFITIKKRARILCNNKSATEDYAKIFTALNLDDYENNRILIRLVKPNGKVEIIGGTDAIKEKKGNIPKVFKGINTGGDQYYFKIAVPNLEVGDIIDYTTEEDVNVTLYKFIMTPNSIHAESEPLAGSVPIVSQTLDIELGENYCMSYNTYNGAPAFVHEENDGIHFYTLTDKNRDKLEDTRWFTEVRGLPSYKFQVVNCGRVVSNNTMEKSRFLITKDRSAPVTKVDKKDIDAKMYNILKEGKTISTGSTAIVFNELMVLLRKNRRLNKDDSDKELDEKALKLFYYYARKNFTTLDNKMLDETFCKYFSAICNKANMPAKLVAVPSKNVNGISDLLLADELLFCIKVGDKFIYPPSRLSNIYDIDPKYEGRTGYARSIEVDENITSVPITIPNCIASDAVDKSIETVTFKDDAMENLLVLEKEYLTGDFKNKSADVIFDADGVLNEEDEIAMGNEVEEEKESNKRLSAREEDRKRKKDETIYEKRKEFLSKKKDDLIENYPKLVSLDSFECIETGRLDDTSYNKMLVQKQYVLGDLVKKIGNNYAFEAGKLIGKQIEITTEEKTRKVGINIENPRSLENEIHVVIPAGYKAEGLDGFTFNVDNAAGCFISNAKQVGNELIFTTKKQYKKGDLDKSEWPNMIAFLDAAYNYTQKKIILKKI
jgi:hypothetical protein